MMPKRGVFYLAFVFFDGLCERIYMMFSIAYQLLQRLFLRVARSGLLLILASIDILLVPISLFSIFYSLHISFLELTFQLSPNF